MNYRHLAAEKIQAKLADTFTLEEVQALIETPKHADHGDVAFPCFQLAKQFKKAPMAIAGELAPKLEDDIFETVVATGPYVNFFFKKDLIANEVINDVISQGSHYGDLKIGNGENITIDWSSPNIAKPFSLGHLRSTVIGNAYGLIANKCDYNAIKINHLGDWGTQFGKLIVAYKAWGSEEAVRTNPIEELLKLYVRFHEEAEENPDLNQQGRDWFKKLEDGDAEATELWKWFRDASLLQFKKIYELLGVSSDYDQGESFYNDKLTAVDELLDNSGLLELDNGAQIVRLDDVNENLPPALIRKSDGASLYITRDLATAIYRKQNWNFAKNVYAVGNEQSLHFQQLKIVLTKLGFDWAEDMIHAPFGLVKKDGKKLSTRKGKIVLLEDVLNDSIAMAEKAIAEKNPNLANKELVAKQVGVGAIIFHDLRGDRMNEIDFNLEHMLKFEGETGPYVQYTNARINSILRKANYEGSATEINLNDKYSFEVVKLLADFPRYVERALNNYEPSVISRYIIDLAQEFNTYYGKERILDDNEGLASRLALLKATSIVLTEGLRLIGIEAPKEM